MNLPCISGMDEEQLKKHNEILKKMLERFNKNYIYQLKGDVFESYFCEKGITMNTYYGKLKDVELSELELSMICDGGFNYFGGQSVILPDKSFKVIIYID